MPCIPLAEAAFVYFLERGVYFCDRGSDLVFLDLKNDNYVLVNGLAADALRLLCEAGNSTDLTQASHEALQDLVAGGLLTVNEAIGKRVCMTTLQAAENELIDEEETPTDATVHFGHVWFFLLACAVASTKLRFLKMESTIASVERRKAHQEPPRSHLEVSRTRRLTSIFLKLRPFFPANYLCLFDSLALLEFLAHYRTFPLWVFGIKLEPWQAHCWVQQGSFVYNEKSEAICDYSVIMAV